MLKNRLTRSTFATRSGSTRPTLWVKRLLEMERLEDRLTPSHTVVTYDPLTGAEVYSVVDEVLTADKNGAVVGSAGMLGADPSATEEEIGTGPRPESVFGNDDRIRVTATTSYPWSTIGRLAITFPSGSGHGSGVMISPFHFLTAGHCVHDGSWATDLQVSLGQDGLSKYFGTANWTSVRSWSAWTSSGDWNHDWALITLDRNIGNHAGWLGYEWWAADSAFNGMTVNSAGYPGDLGVGAENGRLMYRITGQTDYATTNKVYYNDTLDTFGGQSGSGVYRYDGTNRYVDVIHAYGDDGNGYNSGTRITQAKFNDLQAWIASDASPTDRPDLVDYDAWFSTNFANMSTTSVRPGQAFSVTSYPRNNGTAAAGGYTVSFYASTNTTISTGDYFLGSTSMASLSSFNWATATWGGAFPHGIPVGSYYVGWIIDSGGTQTEYLEGNNTGYISSTLLNVLDDNYEQNDSRGAAYDLSAWETTWLSTINGVGQQFDDDWYRIDVTPNFNRVQASLAFTHANGDIDFELTDASGNVLAGSYGVTDTEAIDFVVPTSGTYYLRVFFGNRGNSYDLYWDDVYHNFNPTDIGLSPSSVSENQPINTVVGAFSTTDGNTGDTFTYTLVSGSGSTDNASFNISGSNLRTSASFNFETKSTYNIRVRSTDQGGLFTEKALVVTIVNANEAPTLTTILDKSVDEGSLLSFSASGSDPDAGQTLTYSLVSPPAGAGINPSTGLFNWTPSDSGVVTVTVRVTDNGTGNLFDQKSFQVTIANIVPVAELRDDGPGNEGAAVTVSFGNIFDPSTVDTTAGFFFSYDFNNDNDFTDPGDVADTSVNGVPWTFVDNGIYTVHGRIRDKDGGLSDYTVQITVLNVAPTASIGNGGPTNEGTAVTVSFSNQADASIVDTAAGFTYSYDFNNDGDFTDPGDLANVSASNAGFAFPDSGSFTVRGRIIDKDAGASDYTTVVTIQNVAPTASLANDGPVDEASAVTVSFSGQIDPSSVDTAAGFTYSYDFNNDGDFTDPGELSGVTAASALTTFDDNGTFTIRTRIHDKDGGFSEIFTDVTVANVAPTATLGNSGSALEGQPVSITFTSPFDPSAADAAALLFNFDFNNDGDFNDLGEVVNGPASATYAFPNNGVFTVHGQVMDKDGGFTDYTTQVTVTNVDILVSAFDKGGIPQVRGLDAETKAEKFSFLAYDAAFKGGVRVAVGDVNGDGIPDIITAPGARGNLLKGTLNVKVFDGVTRQPLSGALGGFRPYGDLFKKGIFVAAGDVNGDNFADVIVAPGSGLGPHVKVFSGQTGGLLLDIAAYDAIATFKKGVRVAAGDVNGDGFADIITSAGTGLNAQIKVFNGTDGQALGGAFNSLNPFSTVPNFKAGLFVSSGDVNGDGKADIIASVMKGTPLLAVINGASGQTISAPTAVAAATFKGGVRVASGDVNGDGLAEIFTSTGKAKGVYAEVQVLNGVTLAALDDFFVDPSQSFKGGAFVGGGR